MRTLKATYRIVTPLFLGGADPRQATDFRPPSLKGALRFWWRACYWSSFLSRAGGDTARALRELHAAEGRLFGTAGGTDGATQGRFLLRVHWQGKGAHKPPDPGPGLVYLLGQGLYHFHNGYVRTALKADDRVEVSLLFRPGAGEDLIRQAETALLALGLLGGLGSRARKGFGSLAIERLEGGRLAVPENREDYKTALKTALAHLKVDSARDLPPFTAFSRAARVDISRTGTDPWKLLNEVGAEQQRYRSWGKDGKVAGEPAERNFHQDHDLALQAVQGERPARLPRRIVFGLPHPYRFSALKADLRINPGGRDRGRRASPLLIHIHRFPDGRCLAVQTLLPAVFLPPGDPVKVEAKKLHGCALPAEPDWSVIHDYLNRFADRESLLP